MVAAGHTWCSVCVRGFLLADLIYIVASVYNNTSTESRDFPLLCTGALRLVRLLVALKDETYLKQLIKSGVYAAIVHALVDNGPKYNMLNSSIIELFEYIRKVSVCTLPHSPLSWTPSCPPFKIQGLLLLAHTPSISPPYPLPLFFRRISSRQ